MNELGYPRYCAEGRDWRARVTMALAQRHLASLMGICLDEQCCSAEGTAILAARHDDLRLDSALEITWENFL
jgi:hypothetical protein